MQLAAITTQILDAIQGDPAAIRSLAAAVAAGDTEAVRSQLAARGVEVSTDELAAVLAGARGGATSTITYTSTFT